MYLNTNKVALMSKNILKQLQSQLKSQNTKLMHTLKSEITRTYSVKQKDLDTAYIYKEKRITKAYIKFIDKIKVWKETQNKEISDIKIQIEKINKAVASVESKNVKLNKRLDSVRNELRDELKKEMDDFVVMKGKCDNDVAEIRRRTESRIEKLEEGDGFESIKDIFSSNTQK